MPVGEASLGSGSVVVTLENMDEMVKDIVAKDFGFPLELPVGEVQPRFFTVLGRNVLLHKEVDYCKEVTDSLEARGESDDIYECDAKTMDTKFGHFESVQ